MAASPEPAAQSESDAPAAENIPADGPSWHVIGTGEQLNMLTETYGEALPEEMRVERRSCCWCGKKEEEEVVLVGCDAVYPEATPLAGEGPCSHVTCSQCALIVEAKTFCQHCDWPRRQEEALLAARNSQQSSGSQGGGGSAQLTDKDRARLVGLFGVGGEQLRSCTPVGRVKPRPLPWRKRRERRLRLPGSDCGVLGSPWTKSAPSS